MQNQTEQQRTFDEIEPSFSGAGKTYEDVLIVSCAGKGELIRIHPDGTVWAPSIEAASEAGRVFINTIREALKDQAVKHL